MWPIATDTVAWSVSVCLSVCLSVGHVREPQSSRGLGVCTPNEPLLHRGVDIPHPTEMGNSWGSPARRKALIVSAAVYAAKGIVPASITACRERNHSIVNNSTTCDAAF